MKTNAWKKLANRYSRKERKGYYSHKVRKGLKGAF